MSQGMAGGSLPTVVLLPGLHGTDGLFGPFLAEIPAEYPRVVVAYPADRALDAKELLAYVDERTPRDRPIVIVGESFSGPVATELAALRGKQVQLLVYAASFVCAPKPAWLCHVGALVANRGPRPLFLVRHWLSIPPGNDNLLRQIRAEAGSSTPATMACRLRVVAACNAGDALRRCAASVLYLHSRNDRVVPRRSMELVREIRPDTKVAEFDCGHMILQLRPKEAWDAIASVLPPLR